MLEIMYDIAPGATYKFNTGFLGEQVRFTAQWNVACSLHSIAGKKRTELSLPRWRMHDESFTF